MNVIFETMYYPPVSVLIMAAQRSEFTIERFEHYHKNSFRNVCMIATANGIQRLTVPLAKGKNNQQLITDVRISYDMDWVKQHLAAIQMAYGKSPWLAHFFDPIAEILHRRHSYLWNLNNEILSFLLAVFQIDTPLKYTESYMTNHPSEIDMRNKVRTNNYQNFQVDYYPQLFEDRLGFVGNLSALDYLMCMGRHLRI